MAERKNGDVERAGGFLFIWGELGKNGAREGLVWRDNTEQDFTLRPEGYIRESLLGGDFSGTVMVRGDERGHEMGMPSLEAAAGFIWGYHTAQGDVRKTNAALSVTTGAVSVNLPLEVAEALVDTSSIEDETGDKFRALGREYIAAGLGYNANPGEEAYARLVEAADAAQRKGMNENA
ncbi:hypothetical protein NJL88_08980 [Streptomyces sp. DK15]|uniref:hypothetical protein n=1 Tax=Streptomyces sp. DK15 TaxID=2957499 RepID=UPI0029BB4104|nr:hypothetical protein [Streptomyces sp. DK15]MDX2390197.1 hypothetical protein [Streptomyces sp. DK15]